METWIMIVEGAAIAALTALLVCGRVSRVAGGGNAERVARELRAEMEAQFMRSRSETAQQFSLSRREMQEGLLAFRKQENEQWDRQLDAQEQRRKSEEQRYHNLMRDNEQRMAQLQDKVERRLDEMRKVVDEQLNETLHKRVQSSFEAVGRQLEALQQSLGKVDALRTDVTGLQRIFSNVKTRGTWGEVQLGALLEQILSPHQYAQNVRVHPHSPQFVEYAIRLPGKDDGQACVWLPLDAKFPVEDYLALAEAQENGDAALAKEQLRRVQERIRSQAREIREKYIEPPYTTEFAILYLPAEGLYAEAIRMTGVIETLQREYRVTVAGPTTLAAILNSLQMGFRTLAVQKYSGEVWRLLGAVKKTMEIHARNLEKAYGNIATSLGQLGEARKNVNTIHNRLNKVEEIPIKQLGEILPEFHYDEAEPAP